MKKKILIISIVVFLVFIFYLFRLINRGQDIEPQIHYIPDNYIGQVQILMNQKDGEYEEYDGERRVFRLNGNGELRTKFKPNPGWIRDKDRIQYYYVNSNGEITNKIRHCYQCTKDSIVDKNQVGVLGSGYNTKSDGNESVEILTYKIDTLYKDIK